MVLIVWFYMVLIWFYMVFPPKASDMFTHTVDGDEILHHLGWLKPYK